MVSVEQDSFEEYYQAVTIAAMSLGYKSSQVAVFSWNINDCYIDGKSVEQCVEEVF